MMIVVVETLEVVMLVAVEICAFCPKASRLSAGPREGRTVTVVVEQQPPDKRW